MIPEFADPTTDSDSYGDADKLSLSTEVRMLRRLRTETKDWCNAVQDISSPSTHRDHLAAHHSREVWD